VLESKGVYESVETAHSREGGSSGGGGKEEEEEEVGGDSSGGDNAGGGGIVSFQLQQLQAMQQELGEPSAAPKGNGVGTPRGATVATQPTQPLRSSSSTSVPFERNSLLDRCSSLRSMGGGGVFSYDATFCNYLGVGLDAHMAYLFHTAREANPEAFNNQVCKKLE
jgi:hypothetical protein